MEKIDIYPFQRADNKKSVNKPLKISVPSLKVFANRARYLCSVETLPIIIMAFLCGRTLLFGELSPFGIAFAAGITAVFPEYGLLSAILALAGYTTVLQGSNLAATFGATALIYLLLGKYHLRFRQLRYGPSAVVLGLTTIIKTGVFAYQGADLYRYLTIFFEAALAAGLTYIFFRAAPLLKLKTVRTFKREERLFIVCALVGILAGLNGWQAAYVNVQRAFSSFIVLVAVFIGGPGWGAAAGTLAGAVPSLTSLVVPGLMGYYAFSGLLAGIFRHFGRIGIALGFLLGNILLSVYFNGPASITSALAEGLAAVALFLVFPVKGLHRLRTIARVSFGEPVKSARDQRIRNYSARKIRDFGRVFSEVAKTIEQVSSDLQTSGDDDLQQLFNGITGKVCADCSLYRICWESEFYKTYKNIMDLLAVLELKSRVTEEHIPTDLQKRCIRLKELAITINCLYENYKTNHYWKRKMAESREVVSGQLQGIATILSNLANEVRLDVQMQEDIEAILKSELAKSGQSVMDLTVVSLGDGRLEVNVSCPSCGGKMHCSKKINPIISKILGQRMTVFNNNYCARKTGESICEFKLHPARTFDVNIGMAKAAKNGGIVSGDNCSTVELRDGKLALVLSDGMGVGAKAAMESSATIDLLEQLLETGFDKNLAVKTVNSILVLRTPEETFSTVDLAVLDQYTGKAEFIKIGAAPSFIKRADRVDVVRHSSLPIGILNNIEVECIEHHLQPGDVVIMVSDGILDSHKDSANKEEWIVTLVQSVITTDPQNIADLILNRAIKNAGGLSDDDMTVLVAEVAAGPVQ